MFSCVGLLVFVLCGFKRVICRSGVTVSSQNDASLLLTYLIQVSQCSVFSGAGG